MSLTVNQAPFLFLQQSYELVVTLTPIQKWKAKHREITGLVWSHTSDKWQSTALDPELANTKTSAVISLIPTTTTLFSLATFVLLDGPQIWDNQQWSSFIFGDEPYKIHVEAF